MTLNSHPLSEKEAALKTPLALAYVGDTVWDLLVRQRLLCSAMRVNELHKAAVRQVNAGAQSKAAALLEPVLTDEERAVFRRGCNAHARHEVPKNQSPYDYSQATGLEALMGYLYLSGQEDRISELFSAVEAEMFSQGG